MAWITQIAGIISGKKKPEKADRIFRFAKYAVLFYFIIFIWSGVTAVKTAGPWQCLGSMFHLDTGQD